MVSRVLQILMLLTLLVVAGCTASRPQVSRSSYPPSQDVRAIVFVLDGAGGAPSAFSALRDSIRSQGLPLQIESVDWTHGQGRFIQDETDPCHAKQAGQQLAEQIKTLKNNQPGLPIFLIAHSAGGAPALACGDALPPNTLERMILLAPAVSQSYDMRQALMASRSGIDVFYSDKDWFYLGIGMRILGTADGSSETAGGRSGFVIPPEAMADASPYTRLHQHRWDPSQTWTGHTGGHTGAYKPLFLKTQILPLIWPAKP